MEWLTTLFRAFAKPFQWWVTVAPWERGLRVRLGKVAAELAPGIHLRIPSSHDRSAITTAAVEEAADAEIGSFGCGLGELRVRVTAFTFAKAFRLLMNDYGSKARTFPA